MIGEVFSSVRLLMLGLALFAFACGGDDGRGDFGGGFDVEVPPEPPPPLTFAPAAGTFTDAFDLSIAASDATATVYYTLDGSIPDERAQPYATPIPIDRTTQVRALEVQADGTRTFVDALYVQVAPDALELSSDLPLVIVHMLGRDAPRADQHEFGPASMLVLEDEDAVRAGALGAPVRTTLSSPASIDSRIGFKVRGRSTRFDPKQSYSVELWDVVDQDDRDRPVLGMPAHSDWALYAPYQWDRALIRNALIYALSNDVGRYAVRTRFVEMFLVTGDGPLRAEDYRGLYVFMERIKRGPARLALDKLSPADLAEPAISGGYIVKVDDPAPGEDGFRAADLRFANVYPKEADIAPAQQDYLSGYLERVARAARDSGGIDQDGGLHFRDLIDVGSFVDHHIINTLAKNPDALRLSAYFHKQRGAALQAGPVWDFDRTMGSYDGRDEDPEGWSAGGDGTRIFEHPIWGDLFEHDEFRDAYVARFHELLDAQLSEASIHARIDAMAAEIAEAAARNTERWPDAAPRDGSVDNEIADLRAWISARTAWIRGNLDGL